MSITDNVKRIEDSMYECCLHAGRNPDEVRLMAVSKFFQADDVAAAREAGLTLFGESRVQEASAKFSLTHDVELHLIGALQRNKARKAAALFDCIESVDRDSLIDTLGVLTAGREKPLMVLLELNSGEEQKGGYRSLDGLLGAAERVSRYPGLCARGLMTVAPFTGPQAARGAFRSLAKVREKLTAAFPAMDFSIMSMGMSSDYTIAIEEGSTLVRIGTAIFGGRGAIVPS